MFFYFLLLLRKDLEYFPTLGSGLGVTVMDWKPEILLQRDASMNGQLQSTLRRIFPR